MKRIICFIAIISSLFLSSCETVNVPTNTDNTEITTAVTMTATSITATTAAVAPATTETMATTVSTTGDLIPIEVYLPTGYQKYSNMFAQQDVETPNSVIFTSIKDHITRNTWYYDKISSEIHAFCSDPGCEHVFYSDPSTWTFNLDCPAAMIGKTTNYLSDFSFASVYVNGRVYFVCLSGLYSCTENAKDLREEFKFSENKDFSKEIKKYTDGKYPFICVFSDERSIFFYHCESKKNITQYRYDTSTQKLYDMTEDLEKAETELGYTVYVDSAADGKIYLAAYSGVTSLPTITRNSFEVAGTLVGYYETDYDFSSFEKVEDYIAAPDFVVGDGVIGKLGNDYVKRKYSGEKEVLIENVDDVLGDTFKALYLNGEYLYFVKDENLIIGKKENASGFKRDAVNVNGGRIYRYDLETGDITCVFDNHYYDGFRAVYIDEKSGVCFLAVEKYIELEEKFFDKKSVSVLVRCEINKDGMFTVKEEKYSK